MICAALCMFFTCDLIYLLITFDAILIYFYIVKTFNMNEELFGTYEEIYLSFTIINMTLLVT